MNQELAWNDLKGKNIIVTGGTGEIGKTLIDMLIEKEAKVIILGRNEKKAYELFGAYLTRQFFEKRIRPFPAVRHGRPV